MSDKNINKMDFKGLRNEVQLLRDDIAKWKRLYEDMLYNLDTDNFSSRLVKEKNGMATAIEITAEGLKTKVSQEQLATSLLDYSTITQTATQIELAVVSVNNLTDTKLENYSTITQTAEAITSTVTAEYVNNLIGGGYVTNAMMMSQIEQSSEEILLAVSTEYETKDDANNVYEQLQADISLTSEQIQLKVSATDLDTKLTNYSTIEQTASGLSTFVQRQADLKNAITITSLSQAADTSKTYKIPTYNTDGKVISESYYYYNTLSNQWEKISGDTVYTMFNQTDEGFILKGNTIIDGAVTITRNLVLSGTVTWDMDNSPVKTQYSADSISWHTTQTSTDMYMRMSFDGGNTWSTPTKVVGTDGADGEDGRDGWDGSDGSDANVTAENVFNALTNDGTSQGLFPAFYDGGNKLFINAEYIKTGTLSANRIDTDSLSCTRLYAKGYSKGYYAKMSSNVGDFGVYNTSASDSAYPNNANCIWGIYHSDAISEVVNFYSYGNNYMGYNNSQEKLYPKGIWDFSACDDVQGLDNFVSGGGGGTATAVFG